MKPLSPHDPLDDLIAAAIHGDLTPEERAQFESRLSNDPAARAAYQEALAMHDLLEKTHQSAQPDPAFEQRMVSGVRRKLQSEQHRETAWESVLFFCNLARRFMRSKFVRYVALSCTALVVLALVWAAQHDTAILRGFAMNRGISNPAPGPRKIYLPLALYKDTSSDLKKVIEEQGINYVATAQKGVTLSGYVDTSYTHQFAGKHQALATILPDQARANASGFNAHAVSEALHQAKSDNSRIASAGQLDIDAAKASADTPLPQFAATTASTPPPPAQSVMPPAAPTAEPETGLPSLNRNLASSWSEQELRSEKTAQDSLESGKQNQEKAKAADKPSSFANETPAPTVGTAPTTSGESAPADNRKLVRNAQLDLEVKSFQETMDKITQFTKAAGGYVDTSHSEKGGNGKLQGTVVVKVLPQNLDAFLLKLRDLGQVNNQSVSTDDVTKDYYDTQARLENSRRMETQLQDLLKRENGKVSDLLAVERELGRVRGEIEQMQGQLKLYDFQVQYATVTMNISEKDLNQTAAYLLKEQDDFSLFATDVEGTFQNSRKAAEDFKAQVLVANLNHNSGSDVSALLVVSVPPDQIEPFLAQVRSLGRVANFTRQTQRVAKDGGDSNQPADQTLTEKDKIMVNVSIHSDDESRKQVALTVVAKAVDVALDQAKAATLANAGVEILSSSLNKTPQGESTAQLSVRVPGKEYSTLIDAFNALGRTSSLSIQRNDNSGPGSNGDDAPVIVSLSLTDNDTPLQETEMSVVATDVDAQAQQIKKDAATAGVEVKASSFERQPDGTELAQMTFRLPMAKYPAFVESLKKLGKVESLSVRRDDRPDETRTDDNAPAEISLQLHNERAIVADNGGLWTTLRNTFGEGADALFGSIRVIGVLIAYLAPWVFTLVLFAWIGRRIYIWRKNK